MLNKATQLFNAKLPGEVVHHSGRDVRQVFQESTQEPCRAKLSGKTQAEVIAAMRVDDPAIAVIEKEIPRELLRCWLAGEAGVPVSLIVGEETNRHEPPIHSGEALQNLEVLRNNQNRGFSQELRLQKYAAKDTFMQGLLQRTP